MEVFEALSEALRVQEAPEVGQEDLEAAALEPELMEVPGVGEVLVGGDPFTIGEQLDDHQGDNLYNFQGDCGLVTVRNFLALAGIETTEDEVIGKAVNLGLCHYSELGDPAENGGTSVFQRQSLLETYNIPTVIFDSKSGDGSLEAIAAYVEAGRGVNISVNAGYAWDDPNYINDGGSNHSILVTGTARDENTGELKGLFVCDSGLTDRDSRATFLPVEVLQDAYVNAAGTSALVSANPIR